MKNTAIIIFSRSSSKETTYKKIHSHPATNLHLHTALINKTIKIVEETRLPFFVIDESMQVGNSFGEKFANAINYGFNKNYNSIIAIGNDCPQLSATVLLDAAKNINAKQLVLGPDKNGGIYLLGISSELFNRKTITDIPWQSKKAYTALLQYNGKLQPHEICILERLHDINKPADHYSLKSLSRHDSFILLLAIITCGKKINNYISFKSFYAFVFFAAKQLRAPPVSS